MISDHIHCYLLFHSDIWISIISWLASAESTFINEDELNFVTNKIYEQLFHIYLLLHSKLCVSWNWLHEKYFNWIYLIVSKNFNKISLDIQNPLALTHSIVVNLLIYNDQLLLNFRQSDWWILVGDFLYPLSGFSLHFSSDSFLFNWLQKKDSIEFLIVQFLVVISFMMIFL